MDLRQLRYFVQAVESGSITRAAEALHIVQPSLSLQIKSLEEELGVVLLIRHVRGVSTTNQGRLLYDHACRIIREVERAKQLLQVSSLSPTGQISIGIPTSACRGLASHLLLAGRTQCPGLSIHIVEAMTGALGQQIEAGKVDVALIYNNKASENVAWTEMLAEDLMLVVDRTSRFANETEVEFDAVATLPLALPEKANVLRTVLEHHAAQRDIDLNVVFDCDSLSTLVLLVKSGYATILPHFAVSEEVDVGSLVAVPIVNPTPFWRLSVVTSKRTLNVPGAQAISQLMAKTIGSLVKAGTWRAKALGN